MSKSYSHEFEVSRWRGVQLFRGPRWRTDGRTEQRVVCKACRLQKCRDLGMNLSILKNHKSQYYPKKDKSSKSLTSKNTPGHKMSSPINNATSSNETSILPKILKAYQTLQARQDVLYSSMKKANLFEHPEMHEISVNYNDQLKMGQGIVSLVSSMLEEFCPCLKELDYDFKNEVVQKFFPKFNMLNGGFNTTIKFPDPSDFRIVGHFNTTFDLANLDNFFPVEIFSDEALKAAKDLVIKCRIYSNKLLKLSVTETEISALLVLAFWSEKRLECKEFREKGVESSKINAQISKELYLYALEKYGLENVGIRIGNLMCIFHDVDHGKWLKKLWLIVRYDQLYAELKMLNSRTELMLRPKKI